MEQKQTFDHLEEDQREQLQEDQRPVMIRNPRIVGPDDFLWWLILEQQEQG